jgi:hypothetical protein
MTGNTRTMTYAESDRNLENLLRRGACDAGHPSGAIRFNGIDILQDKTALRRKLGYLPQEFGA